jgi:hypothetical protein
MNFHLSKILSVIVLVLALTGCKNILFENPMPIGATAISEIPQNFNGKYLSLYHTDYSVLARFHRIDRESDFKVVVYEQDCKFIDSAYLEKLQLPTIDTAWFDDNSIHVKTGQTIQILDLNDTLSSQKEKVGFSIDIHKKLYSSDMEDTSSCIISFINDNYYLNIEKLPGLYVTTQLKFIGENITMKTLDFTVGDSINPTSELIEKYQLKSKKEDRGKFYIQHHQASLSNDEFTELLKEEVFHSHIWYKTESSSNYYYWIVLIVIVAVLIFFIRKRTVL